MARGQRAFLFCKYEIQFGEDTLAPESHHTVLQEMQGQKVVHGRSTGPDDVANTLLMRPRKLKIGSYTALTFSAGYESEQTVRATYDERTDEIGFSAVSVDCR